MPKYLILYFYGQYLVLDISAGSAVADINASDCITSVPFWYVGPNKIYGCEVRRRHHLERKNGGGYDAQEYEEHPERYISTFAQKVRKVRCIVKIARQYQYEYIIMYH